MISPYRVKVTSHRPCVTSLWAFGCWFASLSIKRPTQLHKTSLSQVGVSERDGFTIQPELKAGDTSSLSITHRSRPFTLGSVRQLWKQHLTLYSERKRGRESAVSVMLNTQYVNLGAARLAVNRITKDESLLPWIRWNHSRWISAGLNVVGNVNKQI